MKSRPNCAIPVSPDTEGCCFVAWRYSRQFVARRTGEVVYKNQRAGVGRFCLCEEHMEMLRMRRSSTAARARLTLI